MQRGRLEDRLQTGLTEISRLLEKHRLLDAFTERQATSRRDFLQDLQHRQNLVELEHRCRTLHPADLAALLELLPLDDRALVWAHSPAPLRAQALVEMSDAVRWGFVESTAPDELADCLRISRHVATLRESVTVEEALADLRLQGELPRLTDRLFVLDSRHVLRGVVPLAALIQAEPKRFVTELMVTETPVFGPREPAADAVHAFERYDLVSAPVSFFGFGTDFPAVGAGHT